jgi:hypothetical protein
VWTVLGAAVVAAPVATDRIAVHIAEHRLADRLRCVAGVDRPPAVTVHGTPFLSQALRGRYHDIELSATDVHRADLAIRRVHAELHDIVESAGSPAVPRGTDRVRVGEVTVEATVGYAALPGRLDSQRELHFAARDGRLAITTTADVLGRRQVVTILAVLQISGTVLKVVPQEVEAMGVRRPAAKFLERLGTKIDLDRQLPPLPAGLAYASATATTEGVMITLAGRDVTATLGGNGGNHGAARCPAGR